MDNNRADEGLTAQDHERREWRASDVILMFLAVVIVSTLLFASILIMLFLVKKDGGIIGF